MSILWNLLALVVVYFVLSRVMALTDVVLFEAVHMRRWEQKAVFRESQSGYLFGLCLPFIAAALLAGILAWLAPSFVMWLVRSWGVWVASGAAVLFALLGALHPALRVEGLMNKRAAFYAEHREHLKPRLNPMQERLVKPYREAWEAAENAGDDGGGERARVPFEIESVLERQAMVDAEPYHRDGGDWTVLVCRIEGGGRFHLAERSTAHAGALPIATGEARLWVPSSADAEKLVHSIRNAFGSRDKPVKPGSRVAAPLHIGTIVLGRSLQPSPEGGFSGSGSWTATKWSTDDGVELFVNWSATDRRGEFSEKDEGYREDVCSLFDSLLR